MKTVLGILVILAGIVLGFYVGIWVLFIPGVVEVIDGIKASPTDGAMIAWGLVKAFLASTIGTIAFFVVSSLGVGLIASDE